MNTKLLSTKIIDLLDYVLSLKKQKVAFGEFTDLSTNVNYGNAMIGDFGDSLPFVAYVGKRFDNSFYYDLAHREASALVARYQMPSGLFCTKVKSTHIPKKTDLRVFNADKMSDTSLGLHLFYALTKNPLYLEASVSFFNGLQRYHLDAHGFVHYLSFRGMTIPFSSGKFCGLYIEELVNLYRATHDQQYLSLADTLARPWISNSFFTTYGLFPFSCPSPVARLAIDPLFRCYTGYPLDTAMTSKANTNLIHGLTALSSITEDKVLLHALTHWKNAIEHTARSPHAMPYVMWNPRIKERIFLGCDHAVISSLLDMYRTHQDHDALALAQEISDAWLAHQSDGGLFPQGIPHHRVSFARDLQHKDPHLSKLDIQTDFGVVLFKLYQLTKKQRYLSSAQKLIHGVLTHHAFGKGYVDYVDTRDSSQLGTIIETKSLFLLLKLFIAAFEHEEGNPIHKSPLLETLLRDR